MTTNAFPSDKTLQVPLRLRSEADSDEDDVRLVGCLHVLIWTC